MLQADNISHTRLLQIVFIGATIAKEACRKEGTVVLLQRNDFYHD